MGISVVLSPKNDHLFFASEGYADYVTIGNHYNEGGFLPYAVAIHLTYQETPTAAFRIHHFVSDSNDDKQLRCPG